MTSRLQGSIGFDLKENSLTLRRSETEVLAEFVVKRFDADPQFISCGRLVARVPVEGGLNRLGFDLTEAEYRFATGVARASLEEVLRQVELADWQTIGEDRGVLNHVRQLANIAGPVITAECHQRFGSKRFGHRGRLRAMTNEQVPG